MQRFADISRSEIKFFVPQDQIQQIKAYARPYLELDHYARIRKDHRYVVHSLYYDTEDLDFYYEKMDGLKVRKKLRIRTYNEPERETFGFLEIKRRYVNNVFKERIRLPLSQIERIVEKPERRWLDYEESINGRLVLGKFLYNLNHRRLKPTILIRYTREAYLGVVDHRTRLTIDSCVGTSEYPRVQDIFSGTGLLPLTGMEQILELKFDNYMPKWMRNLVQEFNLRQRPISKYCMGVDACIRQPKPIEV